MILSTLSQAATYRTLGPRFAAGLDWIANFNPSLPDGRHEIQGDDVYALVQSYTTRPSAEKQYESHHAYADIQYVSAGAELIHYAPLARLTPITGYDADKDYRLYADPAAGTPLLLEPECFAIFLPADGHKPCCVAGAPCAIRKIVIKVRL